MMADTPNSFKDPYWADLAASTEKKVGLPDGLLVALLTKGERSNADQVSEAGAKTPFQIIPSTRKAAIDKWGIDPYLSPENAAEVSGLLLKDSLTRNKGDAALAVAEYHGGTDRANWGPKTRAYVQRVVGALPTADAAPPPASAPSGQSTFDKVLASQQASAVPQNMISKVYDAYQSGQMAPEEAQQFEQDVQSGLVMLPRGAALKSAAQAPSVSPTSNATAAQPGNVLPAAVLDAYADGRMSPEDKAQLQSDLNAGLVKLPAGAVLGNSSQVAQIPGADPNAAPTKTADPSLTDQVIGAGEAGLNLVTGATTGALGMAGGTIKGLAGSIMDGTFGTQEGVRNVEQAAVNGADAFTYAPRTAVGQERAQQAGQVAENLIPLAPLAGEAAALSHGAAPVRSAVVDQAVAAANKAKAAGAAVADRAKTAAAAAVPERVAQVFQRGTPDAPTPGTMGSVGSAGVDMATQRRELAGNLPVPIELTKGQADRTFEQQRFEQESAKDPSLGAPLRDRFADQNDKILKNFDAWVDQTGAEAPNLRATGQIVDKALVAKAARDKTEIRVAYKEAEKAGELSSPVATDQIVHLLNESSSAESVAPVLSAAKKEMLRLGAAAVDDAGNLVPHETTLGNAELLRRFVNKVAGADPTNIKYAADLKRVIDASTEGLGGDLYRKARGLRARYADQYENHAVISDLLNTKRGTADRKVAFEDVFHRTVMQGSLDDMRTVRKVLQTGGEDGKQAWRELQGQAVQYLKDEATKNVSRDTRGNPIVSAAGLDKAIRNLDRDGKLDYLFGKKGAQQLRDLNDLAKVVYTAPPGSINTSNTASVLLAALDMAISGSAGVPLPVASGIRIITKNIKDRKLSRRINDSLNDPRKKPDIQAPAPKKHKRTLH
jgi:hypothetical protein